jgi:hypothetical protein
MFRLANVIHPFDRSRGIITIYWAYPALNVKSHGFLLNNSHPALKTMR